MKTSAFVSVVALAVLLAACGEAEAPAPVAASSVDAPASIVLGETLRIGDAQAAFGDSRADVETALGTADDVASDNPDCPTGPVVNVSRSDGLALTYRGDRLIGWQSTDNNLRTAEGVMVGMSRAEAKAAYGDRIQSMESTIGDEMAAGEVGFLLGGPGDDARIDAIYAGENCFAR